MKISPILKDSSDNELLNIMLTLPFEFKARIFKLLDDLNITCFVFEKDKPKISIFDYTNTFDVEVQEIGYTIDQISKDRVIYIVDSNNIYHCGDDAIVNNDLWDVYKMMKDSIKC